MRCSPKQRNTSTTRKPFYLSEKTLPRKKRKAGARKSESGALGDRDRSPRRDRENKERSLKRRGNIRDRLGLPQPEMQHQYPPRQFTPLTASVSQVLRETQHEKFLRWPSHMKTYLAKRDSTKYCEFHRDHGHRTDDCIQPRKEIEYLIRRGHLCRFVASEGQDQAPPPSPR